MSRYAYQEAVSLVLAFTLGMPTCVNCQTYLRKLKTATTKTLTPDESANVLQLFDTSDFATMQALLAWQPEERKLDKDAAKTAVTYDLYGCPKCKTEMITASVKIFSNGEWKEVTKLKKSRNIAADVSLRESFT